MTKFHDSLEAAIATLVLDVRADIARGAKLSPRRLVVFVPDGPRSWWTITIDDAGWGDPDSDLLWGANRLARLLRATAAARVEPRGDGDAVVLVERAHARELEVHRVVDGTMSRETGVPFELVPGGPPGVGWGWDQHDDLERVRLFQDGSSSWDFDHLTLRRCRVLVGRGGCSSRSAGQKRSDIDRFRGVG